MGSVGPSSSLIPTFELKACDDTDAVTTASVNDYYANGIISIGYANHNAGQTATGFFNKITVKFNDGQLTAYLDDRIGSGSNKSYLQVRPSTDMPTGTGDFDPTVATNLNLMITQDANMLTKMNAEYCYYYKRYEYALGEFLKEAAKPGGDSSGPLTLATEFNNRLNAFVQILDYIAKQRVSSLNGTTEFINNINRSLDGKKEELNKQAAFLKENNAILRTRKEMIRFTEEKNNHITNQISLWAALNILAIASIFTVYRSMK